MTLSLAQRIRHLRELKQWTQQHLAKKARISRSYISELERGTREPTVGILKRIADAFMVPVDMFFDETTLLPIDDLGHALPPEVRDFLRAQDSVPYIQLAMKARSLNIPEEVLGGIIDALRRVSGENKA